MPDKDEHVRRPGRPWKRVLLAAVVVPAMVLAMLGVALATPAAPQADAAVLKCGYVTCAVYLSRSETKRLADELKSGGGVVASAYAITKACSKAVPKQYIPECVAIGGLAYAAVRGVLNRAVSSRQCFEIKFYPVSFGGPRIEGVYVHSGAQCKN